MQGSNTIIGVCAERGPRKIRSEGLYRPLNSFDDLQMHLVFNGGLLVQLSLKVP